MDKQQAKDYCKTNAVSLLKLQKSKHSKGFICPLCNSGEGRKGTGAFMQGTSNPTHFTCFSCGFEGDYFDIVAGMQGLERGSLEAFNKGYELANISIDTPRAVLPVPVKENKQEAKQEALPNYEEYYSLCNSRANETNYFSLRAINEAMIERFNLGYDSNWISPKALKEGFNPKPTQRIIIPIDSCSYTARATSDSVEKGYQKLKEGSGKTLFNAKALLDQETLIVVEGELDAISIVQCGGNAVGLRSTTNYSLLVDKLKARNKNRPVVLALDNDKAGQETTKAILQKAKEEKLQVKFYVINLYGNNKDANETLVNERELLEQRVKKAMENPALMKYEEGNGKNLLQDFCIRLTDSKNIPKAYLTGFKDLDDILGGGLYAGLYCVGAISSLGKTTFVLQTACSLAKQGFDVLFFSLEMAKEELMAKCISRHTAEICLNKFGNGRGALTTRDVLNVNGENKGDNWKIFWEACDQYGEYAKNIYIVEGDFNYSVEKLRRHIEKHIEVTGRKPVVFVDYLQILGLETENTGKTFSDKQKADKIVVGLKQASRDLEIPLIVISSFNRESYTAPVSQSSFKESGGIEYSCDVLLGLQYVGMDYQKGESSEKRNARIYDLKDNVDEKGKNGLNIGVECKVLKQRNGVKGKVTLDFYPRFNLYTEAPKGLKAGILDRIK